MKHMRVTRLNSSSSPEVAEWEDCAAVIGAGGDEGDVEVVTEGDLVADEFKAMAEPWADLEDFSQVLSSVLWTGSAWLLTSQLHVFAMPLSTPLSSVP